MRAIESILDRIDEEGGGEMPLPLDTQQNLYDLGYVDPDWCLDAEQLEMLFDD